ncbi:hypothetical protein ACSLBF_19300 (plasmid) [Pseudoalteromonas sp. T1lg65]|uniref:hypothetical protein n=1 Tax=Pseudoalteromonas sp. T1lg65 TaxID=2077101 RepID=UPI003F7A6D9A
MKLSLISLALAMSPIGLLQAQTTGSDTVADKEIDVIEVTGSRIKRTQHESEKWWPFANISKYSAVGTEYFISAKYRF